MLAGAASRAIAIPGVAAGRDDHTVGDFERLGEILSIECPEQLGVVGTVIFDRQEVDGYDLPVEPAVQPVDALNLGFGRDHPKDAVSAGATGNRPWRTSLPTSALADEPKSRVEISFDAAVIDLAPPSFRIRRAHTESRRSVVIVEAVRAGLLVPERAGQRLAVGKPGVEVAKIDTDERVVLVAGGIPAGQDGAER